MGDERREALMALGPEALAEALLVLAEANTTVFDAVERMLATPEENVARFNAKVARLKEAEVYHDWNETPAFATQLIGFLADIHAGVYEPCVGAGLVFDFFSTDAVAFEMCDDSHGDVGMVYTHDARDLFLLYAVPCEDKEMLANRLFDLTKNDDYGVRIALLDCAEDYLPNSLLEELLTRFRKLLYAGSKSCQREWQCCIDSLEEQLEEA